MKNKEPFTSKSFAIYFACISFVQNILSFLLGGEKCICCSKNTLTIPLCKSCLEKLWEPWPYEACQRCGRRLISERNLCTQCREKSVLKNVDAAFSLHDYQLWKKNLLFAWKLENKRSLSPYFAALFYQKLKALEEREGKLIPVVPVPPRKGKIREKGWDQIDELCFYLKRGWNVKVLHLLERTSSVQQKKLGRLERLKTIDSSYHLKQGHKVKKLLESPPELVVLADDILTTGSTLEGCARELKRGGIKKVYSITLFIVE